MLFEIGVAVGATVPTLALTQGVQLPSALQGLPVLPSESLDALPERVRLLVQPQPYEPDAKTSVERVA